MMGYEHPKGQYVLGVRYEGMGMQGEARPNQKRPSMPLQKIWTWSYET